MNTNSRALSDILKEYELPVYIRKENWTLDFLFRVDRVADSYAYGVELKNGVEFKRMFGKNKYSLSQKFIVDESISSIIKNDLEDDSTHEEYENVEELLTEKNYELADLVEYTGKIEVEDLDTNESTEIPMDETQIYLEEEENNRNLQTDIDTEIKIQASRLRSLDRPPSNDIKEQGRNGFANTAVEEYTENHQKNNSIREEIESLEKAKEKPYFCHLSLRFDGEEYPEDYFIGERLINNTENGGFRVISWQSDIGALAYDKEKTTFKNKDEETADLLYKRNVIIEKGQLEDVVEVYNRSNTGLHVEGLVYDEFLMKILRDKRRKKELTNIIPSIQQNQNTIIRAPRNENFIVQGCAGSGKTMILLHRISYLMYNSSLTGEDFVVLTPSENFNNHIGSLVNDLSLQSAKIRTISEHFFELLCTYDSGWKGIKEEINRLNDKDIENQEYIDYLYSEEYAEKLKQCAEAQIEVQRENEINISKLRDRREQLREKGLNYEELDKQIRKLSAKRRITIMDKAYIHLLPEFRQAHRRKRPICKAELYANLLLNYYLQGDLYDSTKFVFIDEGQEIPLPEYKLLKSIHNRARFNVYGDFDQKTKTGCSVMDSWADLKEVGDFSMYSLNENYRNTFKITDYINDELQKDMKSLGLDGPDIELINQSQIGRVLDQFTPGNRVAVLVSNNSSPSLAYGKVYRVDDVKGMEFETVIVDPTGMSDNERYVAYSRALDHLYICRE